MQEDEERARTARVTHRRAVESAIAAHNGTLLQYFGDASLSVFSSAVEAVLAAIDIHRSLQKAEAVPVRIGIHQGEIAYDEQGAYGDAVNIAARIEALAVARSILISGSVNAQIENQPSLATLPLGEFRLKHVRQPTEVFAVLAERLNAPSGHEVALRSGASRQNDIWKGAAVVLLSASITALMTVALLRRTERTRGEAVVP